MMAHPYRGAERLAELRTFRMVRSPRAMKILSRMVLFAIAIVVVAMVSVPWQQNSQATGRAIAYAPVERQQAVEAPIEGRVLHWYVHEGDHVEAGAPICDLADNDPQLILRLRQEREAQVARIEAAKSRLGSVESRVDSLVQSRESAIVAAEQRVTMARERAIAADRAREAADQAVETARLNLERQTALFADGLTSKRAVELAELESVRTKTEAERARSGHRAAKSEEQALSSDLDRTRNDTSATISDARATRASAESEIAGANAELARIEVRLARQGAQEVKAPRAGSVLRVVARQGGEMVKAGDPLAILVPDTSDRAVELWVDGNDIPLVTPGRQVRLQFEGWPAVQFAGWPELAIGTFAGTVAFVDAASDDGKGKVRILVIPAEPWPATRYLRQGTRVNGWVLLNRVKLGYEIWRQLNGFPPILPTKEMFQEATAGKGEEKK